MNHLSRFAVAVLAVGAATIPAVTGGIASAEVVPGNPDEAVYDGQTIDLSESWGTARACIELGSVTECFDSEAELIAAHPELGFTSIAKTTGGASLMALADCSSALRLYDGTSYAGSVLYLSTRGVVLNLSSYGFDNVTSSRRNGACAANLYSLANAGGSVLGIPANSQAASMPAGWNNVASSVYIG